MTALAEITWSDRAPGRAWARPWEDAEDLALVHGRSALFQTVREAAVLACGNSWLNLLADRPVADRADDLLVLVSYCYLRGIFRSADVIAALDTDPELAGLREYLAAGPEQVRRFRRSHQRALTDCLTHALVALTDTESGSAVCRRRNGPGGLTAARAGISLLEPYYLAARQRIEQAVQWDSMALDE